MTIVSEKSFVLPFLPYKSIRYQIWPCRKIGQGQPRVTIWINLVVLEHPMLHTKFQFHQPFGSGEEDFLRFLPYIWRPSWSCDQDCLNKLSFPHPMEAPYEIWLQLALWFLRRRCLKSVDDRRQTDDGRRRPTYPISSSMSLRLRWAKNVTLQILNFILVS